MEINSVEQKARLAVNNLLCNPTICNLMYSLKKHDYGTFVHSCDVAYISAQIAFECKLPEKELTNIIMAGLLHDIGKIDISTDLINKKSTLLPQEYMLLKTHCEKGFSILLPYKGIPDIVKFCVLHHHERLDGSGYPDGLKDDEIPLLVKIVSLADAFDAMTSDRAYRSAYSSECALQEIKGLCNSEYDNKIVDVLFSCNI